MYRHISDKIINFWAVPFKSSGSIFSGTHCISTHAPKMDDQSIIDKAIKCRWWWGYHFGSINILRFIMHGFVVIDPPSNNTFWSRLIKRRVNVYPNDQSSIWRQVEGQKAVNAAQQCSLESQMGANAAQQCSVENQKCAVAVQSVWR